MNKNEEQWELDTRELEKMSKLEEGGKFPKKSQITNTHAPSKNSPSIPLGQNNPVSQFSQSPSKPSQLQIIPRAKPDDSSQHVESIAQGLPPVQVSPSVGYLHEGHLGGVTQRGGAVTSPNPPLPPNLQENKQQATNEEIGTKTTIYGGKQQQTTNQEKTKTTTTLEETWGNHL